VQILYQSLWLIAVFFFAVNIVGFLKGFFSFHGDVSMWMYAFGAALLAVSTAQYYAAVGETFARVLLLFILSFACYLCAICAVYTAIAVLDRSLFTPRMKWGPASFMKLTHEAFRFAIPTILQLTESLSAEDPYNSLVLVNELEGFFKSFQEHGRHEDLVFVPLVRGYFPGLNPGADEEHKSLDQRVGTMLKWLQVLKNAPPSLRPTAEVIDAVTTLRTHLPLWCQEAQDHMRNEEHSILTVVRKYVPIERQREATRKSFNLTSSEDWHVTLPYLLKNLPMRVWKVQLVRCFVWVSQINLHCILEFTLYTGYA
jgi:hemerythrin-like domain-containing protein